MGVGGRRQAEAGGGRRRQAEAGRRRQRRQSGAGASRAIRAPSGESSPPVGRPPPSPLKGKGRVGEGVSQLSLPDRIVAHRPSSWLAGWLPCCQAWLPGCLAAWLPGCLAAWLPGCLAAWLPFCLAAFLPGCLTAWLAGDLIRCWLCCLAAEAGRLSAWLHCRLFEAIHLSMLSHITLRPPLSLADRMGQCGAADPDGAEPPLPAHPCGVPRLRGLERGRRRAGDIRRLPRNLP